MNMPVILIVVTAVVALAILGLALAGPSSGKAKTRRLSAVKDRHAASTEAVVAAQMRKTIAAVNGQGRNSIASMMPRRELLELRLRRTGKNWTVSNFMLVSMGAFLGIAALLTLAGAPILMTGLLAGFFGLALPHFVVGSLIKRRVANFTKRFPDAIDLLVRGLKSGLPITETFGLVSTEIPGPVGEEFKAVTERIRIGKTMDLALQDSAEMLDTPEFQFFCITIAIQRETGGNLAETLNNLSEVLRKRAQMKLKIRAMSSEAKASAYIVGALPFFVFGLVYTMNPGYVAGFFYEDRLIAVGIGGMVWMGIGAGIMAKMISFEI